MRLTAVTLAAALALAAPALAQEAAPTPAPTAAPQQLSPEDLAFQQKGQAFDARLQTMIGEIDAAVQGAGTDAAKADADVVAILARYDNDFSTFAADLEAFLNVKLAAATTEEERAGIQQALSIAPGQVRAIPQQVRTGVAQAMAQRAAQAAAPAAATQQ